MKKDLHILLVEDDVVDAELTQHALRDSGLHFCMERVETREDYLKALKTHKPALILSDYSLPLFNGHEALEIARAKHPEVPFIFVTGTMGEEVAIETLKSGATDYVLKTKLSRLMPAVGRALREARNRTAHRRSQEQLRESHERLRALSVYLQSVREEERTRIAREVHDGLGQALTSCKLDLSLIASKLPARQKALRDQARNLSAHIDSTIRMVRRIATELRPGVLDHLGLTAALEWQAADFQNRTGIKCEVHSNLGRPLLDSELSTAFFRIFQETLTNVIRHAGATEVGVELRETKGQITLQVRDNGRGITRQDLANPRSLGLLGMRERAELLGGTFKIQPMAGRPGTRVTVTIPDRRPPSKSKAKHENTASRRPRRGAQRTKTDSRRRVHQGDLRRGSQRARSA